MIVAHTDAEFLDDITGKLGEVSQWVLILFFLNGKMVIKLTLHLIWLNFHNSIC